MSGRKWSYRSSATCWVATNGSVTVDFPTERLAKEYIDFKNSTRQGIGEPPFASDWSEHMRSLLGKDVDVTIDRDKPVVVTGTLLSFNEGGEVAIREEDGFVTWCWPALEAEVATRQGDE